MFPWMPDKGNPTYTLGISNPLLGPFLKHQLN